MHTDGVHTLWFQTLDAYAPFLYDATLLWAILVNQTMAADVDPRNGSYIFQRAQAASTKGK